MRSICGAWRSIAILLAMFGGMPSKAARVEKWIWELLDTSLVDRAPAVGGMVQGGLVEPKRESRLERPEDRRSHWCG